MSKTYKLESILNGEVQQTVTYETLKEAKAKAVEWSMYNSKINPFNHLKTVITCVVNGFDVYSLTRRPGCSWKKENLTKLVDINIKWPV
jgi:hypothetical protein